MHNFCNNCSCFHDIGSTSFVGSSRRMMVGDRLKPLQKEVGRFKPPQNCCFAQYSLNFQSRLRSWSISFVNLRCLILSFFQAFHVCSTVQFLKWCILLRHIAHHWAGKLVYDSVQRNVSITNVSFISLVRPIIWFRGWTYQHHCVLKRLYFSFYF